MGKSTISMVIFNSYVKLPEGTCTTLKWPSTWRGHHCFVLVDAEFHQLQAGKLNGYNFSASRHASERYALRFTASMWRTSALCQAQWCHRQHPRQYLHLRHGNHLRIAVPPPESDIARVPTRCVARMFQMDIAPEDVEAYYYIMNDIGIIPVWTIFIPVVPHKAVAEVSKIGNL
jgi:hypothetical protein